MSSVEIERLADAFEVSREQVLQDLSLVQGARNTDEQALLDRLRQRHGWDASVAPYYLDWLRRRGRPLPE